MVLDSNLSKYNDKQFIKFQERPDDIPEGETPINIQMVVYDEMVDECKPGDAVDIIGIYRAQSKKASRNAVNVLKSVFSSYIDVISIVRPNDNKVVLDKDN